MRVLGIVAILSGLACWMGADVLFHACVEAIPLGVLFGTILWIICMIPSPGPLLNWKYWFLCFSWCAVSIGITEKFDVPYGWLIVIPGGACFVAFNWWIEDAYDIYKTRNKEVLEAGLQALPENERVLFRMYYFCNLSLSEISEMLELDAGSTEEVLGSALYKMNYFASVYLPHVQLRWDQPQPLSGYRPEALDYAESKTKADFNPICSLVDLKEYGKELAEELLRELPEEQRLVFEMHNYMELDEIAEVMETDIITTKVRFRMAKEKLTEWLSETLDEEITGTCR